MNHQGEQMDEKDQELHCARPGCGHRYGMHESGAGPWEAGCYGLSRATRDWCPCRGFAWLPPVELCGAPHPRGEAACTDVAGHGKRTAHSNGSVIFWLSPDQRAGQ